MTSIFIRRTPAWRYIVVWGVAMALGASLASWRKPNATKADPAGPPSHPWIKAGHDVSPSCPSPSDTVVGEGARTPEALLQAVLTNAPPPPDPYNELLQLARQDASLRTRLLERFRTESDPQNSRQLGAILTSLGTADVSAFSVKLARSADPHERVLGLKLLGGLQSPTPDTQRAITLALATETNPEALSIAVAAAAPGPMRAPEEVAGMVERMQKLAQHESADVRAAALISLARWGGPAVSEPRILEGFRDANPKVQEASAFAAIEARVQSDALRSALFDVGARSDAPLPLRQMALGMLGSWNLDQEQFNKLNELRKQVPPPG